MSGVAERMLLVTRETRRSAGLLRGVVAPLLCLAVMVGVPYLDLRSIGLEALNKVAAGIGLGGVLLLLWWLSFIGRQHITVSNERLLVESGFWTRTRNDIEVFRIRDVVVTQSLWHRLLGVGNVTVKATEGRGQPEEAHTLRGVVDPVAVAEVIRRAWNDSGRPRSTTNVDG